MDFLSGSLQSEFLRKRIISFLREDEGHYLRSIYNSIADTHSEKEVAFRFIYDKKDRSTEGVVNNVERHQAARLPKIIRNASQQQRLLIVGAMVQMLDSYDTNDYNSTC